MATTISSRYKSDDSARSNILERARACAALSKPHILPPANHGKDDELPENFQSLGSRGSTNLEGRLLLALFPPGRPWFQLKLRPEVQYDPNIDPRQMNQVLQGLFLREMQIIATLESANLRSRMRRSQVNGFRSRRRSALSQCIITGDVLEKMNDDYRITTFRRDRYVTRRDSEGDVLYHITKQSRDVLALEEGQFAKTQLPSDLLKKDPGDRLQDMFTLVEWQPKTKIWSIVQEINGQEIATSDEPVCPYFSTTFELAPEEDYGRGFIEMNYGDMRTLDNCEEKLLEFAATASRHHPVIDQGSIMRDEDLEGPRGMVLRGRVSSGQVQDIAFLKVDKISDFHVVDRSIERKTKELSKAMLLESEIQPQKERVTATQIQRIAAELEGGLGGIYAQISESQQVPIIERAIYQLQAQKLMPELPSGLIDLHVVTGIEALSREIERGKLMDFAAVVSQLGPEAMSLIDTRVFIDVMARHGGVHEPGLIKSDDQINQERAAALEQQAASQAVERGVNAAGDVATTAVEQELQPAAT